MEEERPIVGDGWVSEGKVQAWSVLDRVACLRGFGEVERELPDGWSVDPKVISTNQQQLGAFADDARHAIQTAPDYFVWWYTAKSIGLAVTFAALTFMIGRATKGCR